MTWMRTPATLLSLPLALALAKVPALAGPVAYAWTPTTTTGESLDQRFPPPAGFERMVVSEKSWGAWLRDLPMKPTGAPVLTYTGAPKSRQDVHAAVIDIDAGTRDLQQCADAVMRLRAEWLYGSGRAGEIAFNDTDGKRRKFSSQPKKDYPAFRKYLNLVFAYAGTWSLELELKAASLDTLTPGDVFIKGGFPGHAVLVIDVVENRQSGERRFLLAQSYMPAQDIHILKNPSARDGSPWYATDFGDVLDTPEWDFPKTALKRWPGDWD